MYVGKQYCGCRRTTHLSGANPGRVSFPLFDRPVPPGLTSFPLSQGSGESITKKWTVQASERLLRFETRKGRQCAARSQVNSLKKPDERTNFDGERSHEMAERKG